MHKDQLPESLFCIGKKMLISTDNWFVAPDGIECRSAYGTVKAVLNSESALGVKTNAHSTNWYVEIGNIMIAGCQIHYAVASDSVNTGPAMMWAENNGAISEFMRASKIYDADRG